MLKVWDWRYSSVVVRDFLSIQEALDSVPRIKQSNKTGKGWG